MRFIHLTLADGRQVLVDASRIVSIAEAKLPHTEQQLREVVAWIDPERNLDEMSKAAMKRFVQERMRTAIRTDDGGTYEVQEHSADVANLVQDLISLES